MRKMWELGDEKRKHRQKKVVFGGKTKAGEGGSPGNYLPRDA